MDDRAVVWEAVNELAESGEAGVLASVSRRRGSCPMASDAKMLVTNDGRQWGTVGGGCIEAEVIKAAVKTAQSGVPGFSKHKLNADAAGDIGLSCGGSAEFFLEPLVFSTEMKDLYQQIASAIHDRVPLIIYTAADWSDGPQKAIKFESQRGSGAEAQELTVSVGGIEHFPGFQERVSNAESTFFDEAERILVESIPRKPRVVIFGAGHVGIEIARAARSVGFHVAIVDDREEFANAERIPWANEVIVDNFSSAINSFVFDEDDYLLATTRGHNYDALVVEGIAESRARYVGMLGSRRKRVLIRKALEDAGVAPEALDRVRTPIGLDIGADSPAEIAVSVVAELIKVRRLGLD